MKVLFRRYTADNYRNIFIKLTFATLSRDYIHRISLERHIWKLSNVISHACLVV